MNDYLQRAHEALSESAGSLTLDQLTARPPGKWTIGEILEHLSRAFSHTSTGAQRAIAAGQPSARPRDARSRFRAFVVVRCGYLPTGVESPKMVMPVGIDPALALSTAVAELRRMHA